MQSDKQRDHLLKAGAAQVEITPEPGIPLTGFIARLGSSTGIHDPLFARSLALETEGQRVLVITCDLLALDAEFVCSVRAAIREATDFPECNILIACTHTHSGPATIFLRDCGEVDRQYLDRLRLALLEVAQKALANLQDARMRSGQGHSSQGVRNRRQPGEPIDPDVGVISFQDQSGGYLAILVNYACHPVCLDHTNRLISADYPGVLQRTLQEQTGAVVLFTNGATGDLNPERKGSFEIAEELGANLTAETLRILSTSAYQDCAVLQVNSEIIDLPLLPVLSSDALDREADRCRQALAEAEAVRDVLQGRMQKAMIGWTKTTLVDVMQGIVPTRVSVELQVIQLGGVILAGIPGELFSELGKEIKRSASCQVMVVGYANGDIGYIPTRQAYAKGGYEIEEAYKFYGFPSALAPEAGGQVLQSISRLMEMGSSGSADRSIE